MKIKNQEYLDKYPQFWELLLPKIPAHIRGAKVIEEIFMSKEELFDELTGNLEFLWYEDEKYIAVWVHEAYEYYSNSEIRQATNSPLTFKIRFVEFEDLRLAVIRRKWPTYDFLVLNVTEN